MATTIYSFPTYAWAFLYPHFPQNMHLKFVAFLVNFSDLQSNGRGIDDRGGDFSWEQVRQYWNGLISWVLFQVIRLPFSALLYQEGLLCTVIWWSIGVFVHVFGTHPQPFSGFYLSLGATSWHLSLGQILLSLSITSRLLKLWYWFCLLYSAFKWSRVLLTFLADLLTQCFQDYIYCFWCWRVWSSTQSGHRGFRQSKCKQ